MYNLRGVVNLIILLLVIILISIYGLDVKEPYPKNVVLFFSEPYVRVISYLVLYLVSLYNYTISFVLTIMVILLHNDYVMLAT